KLNDIVNLSLVKDVNQRFTVNELMNLSQM
ncbi:unnamed protein product, partial [marine sediment metagenome]